MNQHPLSSILLLQTKPIFPKILATTALCLAALGLGLMFSLRGVSPELGVSGFTLAFLTFFPTIYTLLCGAYHLCKQ